MKKLILILLLMLLFPLQLKANGGLELTPAFREIVIKPGDILEGSFSLINKNEFDLTLGKSNGYISSDGTITLEEIEANKWIEYDMSDLKIQSLKSFELKYKINIPLGTEEGMYQPMIILEIQNQDNGDGSNASIAQLLPFQFKIFVSQSEQYNAELKVTSLAATNTIALGTNQNIDFSIINVSPSPAKPLIRVQVVAPDGQISYQTVENESLSTLLKDQTISKSLNISNSFTNDSKIGKYSIELLLTDTLTSKSIIQKTSFIYIPQSIINLIILVVFIILLVGIFIIRRKNSPKKDNKEHVFKYK